MEINRAKQLQTVQKGEQINATLVYKLIRKQHFFKIVGQSKDFTNDKALKGSLSLSLSKEFHEPTLVNKLF